MNQERSSRGEVMNEIVQYYSCNLKSAYGVFASISARFR